MKELKKINLKDIEFRLNNLLSVDVYLNFKLKKSPLHVFKKGTYINQRVLSLMSKDQSRLTFKNSISASLKLKVDDIFSKLHKAEFEEERVLLLNDLLFLNEKNDQLNLSILMFENLFNIDRHYELEFFQKNEKFFRQSLSFAYNAVIVSICLGYYDYYWLEDIYNLSLLSDIELSKNVNVFDMSFSEILELRKFEVLEYEFSWGGVLNFPLKKKSSSKSLDWIYILKYSPYLNQNNDLNSKDMLRIKKLVDLKLVSIKESVA